MAEQEEPTASEIAERWRVAGRVLRLLDPIAFEALLHGAEVMIVEGVEVTEEISLINFVA